MMDFYYMDISAPCRAVMLTAKALGIQLNKKTLNLFAGEQNTPEFLAINFQHTIPTLVDGQFNLWESRAICAYLVNQYGKDDSLYPYKDPKVRAQVDRLLYFDEGTFYNRFGQYVYPVAFGGQSPDPAKLEPIQGALEFLEKFLDGHNFAVGDNITIADHSLVASLSSMVAFGIDISKFPKVQAWFQRCKTQMPGYETENGAGATKFGEFIKEKFVGK